MISLPVAIFKAVVGFGLAILNVWWALGLWDNDRRLAAVMVVLLANHWVRFALDMRGDE